MRQHVVWQCRDCSTISDTGLLNDVPVTIDDALRQAENAAGGETLQVKLYCEKCKEIKGTLHLPAGTTLVVAYEGRVFFLTSFVEDEPASEQGETPPAETQISGE